MLGEVLHESNLIFDFFIASNDSTKANKANHDSMVVFKSDSVQECVCEIIYPDPSRTICRIRQLYILDYVHVE